MNIIPLQPHYQYRLWGGSRLRQYGFQFDESSIGEAWTASALEQGGSIVSEGPYKGKTLRDLYREAPHLFDSRDSEFPLLIKWIDANDDLSIQVHPNNRLAESLEGEPYGKNECWYILDAPPSAEIVYGHTYETSDDLKEALATGKVMEGLIRKPVQKGDFLYVPAGTIHALTKGISVLEIQQSSDTTYRLYDYERLDQSGKQRELHVEKGTLASFSPHLDYTEPVARIDHFRVQLTKNPYFYVERWSVQNEETIVTTAFQLLSVVEGSLEVDGKNFDVGSTLLLPAHTAFTMSGHAVCLVTGVSSPIKEKARIGIDLGGTNTRVAVVSPIGRLEKQFKFKTLPKFELELTLKNIEKAISYFQEEYEIESVGIVAPGPLDLRSGSFLTPPNLPNWHHQALIAPLKELIGLPVFLENDANAAALAEAKFGAGRNADSVFYVTVSTGIGGGFVYKKQIISGAHGSAGEIGNMIIRAEGPDHHTLNVGALETHASGTALKQRAEAKGLHDNASLLNDEVERRVFVDDLATGLANIIHTVDPDVIILGGGVTASAPLYWKQLQHAVADRVYPHLRGATPLVLHELKGDAGVIGAAFLS